ncbi:MAG: epoxide hydrolase [Deltaproteobacteria bacterium]|nr:epoxide hydrolase [Deltaproteobacteria bacterium]
MAEITPFEIEIPDEQISDLKQRLANTRWPEKETVDDWSQGIPLGYLQEVCEYWAKEYDWRDREAKLNRFSQFKTNIQGLDVHFVHVKSPEPAATPLIMTHGWPGSIVEFQKVIGPLSDPVAHGGKAEDAFHVICPSLPGYGFSDKPTETGWGLQKIAEAWAELMARLGYEQYVAQGGDWGAMVTTCIGGQDPAHCLGIHLNMAIAPPTEDSLDNLTELEQRAMAGMQHYQDKDSGYSKQQSTRPQSLGYGLVDSPVGQAGWIMEKFWSWTDCSGHPENALTRDEMLDNVMLYWLPATAASSARLYWESFASPPTLDVDVPVGVSVFPHEIFQASRRWCEARYSKLAYYNDIEKGGHFAAFEQPELFVDEVRAAFRAILG